LILHQPAHRRIEEIYVTRPFPDRSLSNRPVTIGIGLGEETEYQ